MVYDHERDLQNLEFLPYNLTDVDIPFWFLIENRRNRVEYSPIFALNAINSEKWFIFDTSGHATELLLK